LPISLTGKKAGVFLPYRRGAAIVYDGGMNRNWLGIAAINGALAVMAGAFAAHGLKAHLNADSLAVFETGARYHMYHALAMAVAALVPARSASIAFMGGIVLFSGSLYLLALTGIPILGAITPLGGLCFIAGWALLAWRAFKGPI
jgi:uncharacterized membrane protein YgdD (TMEM256/DUF423 family)